MRRAIRPATLLLLCLLCLAPAAPAPGAESTDEVEKELAAIVRELDAIRSELDLLDDMARVPKATGVRIEIGRKGDVAPPAVVRLLLDGRVEEERETGRADREAFAAGAAPLAVTLPLLPGRYAARAEVLHPAWKTAPGADFPLVLDKGTTAVVRLTLVAPATGGMPVLVPSDAGTPVR